MKKALIIGGIAGGALVAALLAGVGAPEQARGQEGPATRTVTVNGVGTVEAKPDEASFSFGVESKGETARDAMEANADAARRLIAALKAAGVADDEIQTQNVSVWPAEKRGDGYTASNSVRVSTSIARAGALVEVASGAGANSIYGPTLTRSESHELEEQALERALDEARRKAAALAEAAGADLGEVVRLVEGGASHPYYEYGRLSAAATDAGPPIEGGRIDQRATLTVTFALQ